MVHLENDPELDSTLMPDISMFSGTHVLLSALDSSSYKHDKWGIVEPSLTRNLGEIPQKYIRAMLRHDTIQSKFDRISYLIND